MNFAVKSSIEEKVILAMMNKPAKPQCAGKTRAAEHSPPFRRIFECSEWTNLDGKGPYEEMGVCTSKDTSLIDSIDTCVKYCNLKRLYNHILGLFMSSSNNPSRTKMATSLIDHIRQLSFKKLGEV